MSQDLGLSVFFGVKTYAFFSVCEVRRTALLAMDTSGPAALLAIRFTAEIAETAEHRLLKE